MKLITFIVGLLAFILTAAVPSFATTYYGSVAHYSSGGYGHTAIAYNYASADSAAVGALASCG